MTDVRKYAEALFLLADEEGILQKVLDDLSAVNTVLSESPEYTNILDTPALPKEERFSLCEEAFGILNEYVKNVIKMLSSSHNTYAFSSLYKEYKRLYNEKCGIVEIEAVSAVARTESEKDRLAAALKAKLSKTVVIHNTVDKSILGGLIIRYDSLQLNGSVRRELERIEQGLRATAI